MLSPWIKIKVNLLLLQVFLDFLLLHSSPLEWKGHLFWGVSLKGLVGLHAAAKSLQSCPTLCDPIDSSPPGSPVPGIPQARTPEWVAISFSNAWKWKVKVKSLSCVQLLAIPWTAAYQAPPSMEFYRQEYWSGVPLPSPVGLHRTVQFSFFSVTGWGIGLVHVILSGLPWKWTEIILLFLRLHPSTAFQTLLLTMMATPFLLRDSCPR